MVEGFEGKRVSGKLIMPVNFVVSVWLMDFNMNYVEKLVVEGFKENGFP